MKRVFGAIALLTLVFVAAPVLAAECDIPSARDDGWEVASPESVGIDGTILCALGPRMADWAGANFHGAVVIRHGKLVYERYFTGFDRLHATGPATVAFDAGTKHDLRSMTKSVTALVTGAALGRDLIADIDRSVLSFFPEYADLRSTEKDQITTRHLLMMSMGLGWKEGPPWTDENAIVQLADPYRYVLALPMVDPPGTVFNYSAGSTALIGAVLQKATGQRFEALAQTLLLYPLGITDVSWTRIGSGDVQNWARLHLRPRDMAKLGQLVLQRGRWKDVQVVPEAWIEAATSPQIAVPRSQFRYGYQFWIDRRPFCRPQVIPCADQITVVAAFGQGGQRIYIVPALDLVVVTTAGHYYDNEELSWKLPLVALTEYVLPAVDARP